MMTLALLAVALLIPRPVAPQQPDYAALYEQGISYERFLAGASARAEEWRRNSEEAVVAEEATATVRALESPRRVLVVTAASCSDSVSVIPYLAKLVALAPEQLEMRIIDSTAGRRVMEAHPTPDGRAATPTVIVLDADGRVLSAWIERPVALQQWHAEQKVTNTTRALLPAKMQWYADDAGRSTVTELVTALTTR
jgi:hypothetical protein